MNPQRRPYFGVSDGQGQGAKPQQAMPMTGTGTDMSTEQFDTSQTAGAGDPMAESPDTMRRRLMPIAGNAQRPTDALAVMRQALAQDDSQIPQAPLPPWGGVY